MSTIIQLRRDTVANWTSANPILAQGEKGYEIDSIGTADAKYKIGDGVTTWNALSYQGTGGGGGAVDSVNGEVGVVVLDTSDISETTDKNYVTDDEKTVIGNTSGTNTGDETTSTIESKRPVKSVNGTSVNGAGNIITPNTEYTDSEIKTKYEANSNTNAFTDSEKTNLGNQSNTNTGDQDISGLQPILSEGAFVDGDKTKLDGIATGAEVNTINSTTTGEPTGSDKVLNMVSLTQAEYDNGTPISTTFYIITP